MGRCGRGPRGRRGFKRQNARSVVINGREVPDATLTNRLLKTQKEKTARFARVAWGQERGPGF